MVPPGDARAPAGSSAVRGLDAETEVHRIDHVGGILALGDRLDGAADALDGGDELVPLGAGKGVVARIEALERRFDLEAALGVRRPVKLAGDST